MQNKCPVCSSKLNHFDNHPDGRDATFFSCPKCGDFTLSGTLVATLPKIIERDKDASAKISHTLWRMQQENKGAELYTNTIEEILKKDLPKPREQADLLIRWLAEHSEGPGKNILLHSTTHNAIIGAKSPEGFDLVIRYLLEKGLVKGKLSEDLGPSNAYITLSIDGWDYYEQLRDGGSSYRKAFMAMKFGNSLLDQIVENVFRPCVKQTGFELVRLDDMPKAGLIDDRLRVEIQTSDFLIADLTHDNLGAYWEAGYAEGLGKPVIYTCEKEKFRNEKTHFDTNHHLTIIWDKDTSEKAGEDLKATIRATLPQLAIQED